MVFTLYRDPDGRWPPTTEWRGDWLLPWPVSGKKEKGMVGGKKVKYRIVH
jgi:hypothetical protein